MTIEDLQKALDQLRNRTGKEWAWFFYQELGYRITDSREDEQTLKKTMDSVFDETLADKVSVFRQSLEDSAVTGETIRFAIDSFDKDCDWQKKHNIQDMKFVPLKEVFAGDFARDKRIRELEETCKILSDETLMKRIRKQRKNGSSSSPYKPLATEPPKLVDIADMPNFNLKVKDGLHSVSEGKIFWTNENFVTCKEHGACNAMNKDLTIWRCVQCHEGAYVQWNLRSAGKTSTVEEKKKQ